MFSSTRRSAMKRPYAGLKRAEMSEGGWDTSRFFDLFVGYRFLASMIFLIMMSSSVLVCAAGSFEQVSDGFVVINLIAKWFVSSVEIVGAIACAVFSVAAFVSRGSDKWDDRKHYMSSLLASLVWMTRGQGLVAASWIVSTWSIVYLRRSGAWFGERCLSSIILVMGILFLFLFSPIGNTYVYSAWLYVTGQVHGVNKFLRIFETSFRQVSLRRSVDQTSVKVSNYGDTGGGGSDREFAHALTCMSMKGVPDAELATVTRIAVTSEQSESFRRWAMLGDSLLDVYLSRIGCMLGKEVGVIDKIRQDCLSREALGRRAEGISGIEQRSSGKNGVASKKFKSEVVEAVVGVAYFYGFRDGLGDEWNSELAKLCMQLGIFNKEKL